MAWSTPKTDWAAGNTPLHTDFNRIEGNISYIENDSRTPSQTATPTVSGKLSVMLNFFATQIKKITGKTNWYDAPTKSLEDKLDKSGGWVTGPLVINHELVLGGQVRNIHFSPYDPVVSDLADGDIWIKYGG